MRDEQIEQAAEAYAAKYRGPNKRDEWGEFTMSKLGFTAGANWAYAHGCIDPDSAELAGYKRGLAEAGRPQNVTDDQIMAVLNAIGYEESSWIEMVRTGIRQRYE